MKDKNESFMHYQAKVIFASWLREKAMYSTNDYASLGNINWRINRGGPHYGVFDEYSITDDSWCHVWDERNWWCNNKCKDDCNCEVPVRDWPDYNWMKKNYKGNYKIADIVIQHKGMIIYIIEIVHKNEISEEKKKFYKGKCYDLLQIPAHWIMGQVGIPDEIPKEFFIA